MIGRTIRRTAPGFEVQIGAKLVENLVQQLKQETTRRVATAGAPSFGQDWSATCRVATGTTCGLSNNRRCVIAEKGCGTSA